MLELDIVAGIDMGLGIVTDDDIESVEIINVVTNCSKRFDFN